MTSEIETELRKFDETYGGTKPAWFSEPHAFVQVATDIDRLTFLCRQLAQELGQQQAFISRLKFDLKDVIQDKGQILCDIGERDAQIKRLRAQLATPSAATEMPKGWSCPNCKKAHSPETLTCPYPKVDDRAWGERVREANRPR